MKEASRMTPIRAFKTDQIPNMKGAVIKKVDVFDSYIRLYLEDGRVVSFYAGVSYTFQSFTEESRPQGKPYIRYTVDRV